MTQTKGSFLFFPEYYYHHTQWQKEGTGSYSPSYACAHLRGHSTVLQKRRREDKKKEESVAGRLEERTGRKFQGIG